MKPWPQLVRHLRNVLRRHGRTDQEAEDLIQDAFVRLECYRREKPVDQPEAFLVRTVLNLSVDSFRHNSRHPEAETLTEDTVVIDTAPRPDEVCMARQRLNRLSEGLEALSPQTRDIFLAHRLEGLGQAEIAKRHGLSLSSVEKHIAKALLFLTEWVGNE